MRWPNFIISIHLLSFCYGQKFDTTAVVTLNFSSESSRSCRGCKIDIHDFEYTWYDQAYTHVAETIVKYVNNATNATITSTIRGSSFTLPYSAAYDAQIVPNSVITTVIGGVAYTLTYPSKYAGIGGIKRYTSTPITNANGTVKCVVSQTILTKKFLLREYISNGLELSAFIDQDFDPACEMDMVSPPLVLVRVSSLTTTTTNYVDSPDARTSSAQKASPSNSLSPPTAPRTESSKLDDRPTTVLASPPPRKTADVPSVTPPSVSTEPIQLDKIGSVLPATTLLASENREAELVSTKTGTLDPSNSLSPPTAPQTESSKLDDRPTTVLASPPPRKTADVPSITPPSVSKEPIQLDKIESVLPATTLLASENREAELVSTKTGTLDPSNSLSPPTAPRTESSKLDDSPTAVLASPPPRKTADLPSITPLSVSTKPIQLDKIGTVLRAITLLASEDREAELVSTQTGTLDPSNSLSPPAAPRTGSSKLGGSPTAVLANPPPRKTADVPSTTPPSLPVEPIQLDKIGSVLRAITLVASENREAELAPTKTGTLDQPQESSNGNPAFRPGEPTPTVPVSQVSRARPSSQVFGIPEIVLLSTDFSLPIGSSSILKPSDSFPTGDQIFSRPNGKPVTTPTSLGLPSKPNHSRPTSLPSILTFTEQKFTVANPSNFFLSGTAEIHRDGSTIITSATGSSISLGNSATVVVHDSSTTPLAVYIVAPLSQVPGSEVTEKPTSALPSAVTAAGNHSELFLGGQMRIAEVPMFVILGATLFGIVVPWGLRYV